MALTRSQSFKKMPIDMVRLVLSYLNDIEMRKVNKQFYQAFEQFWPLVLIDAIQKANYQQIEHVFHKRPEVLFKLVDVQSENQIIERISPLGMSFKLYDTYTWLLLRNIAMAGDMSDKFVEQLMRPVDHLGLENTFAAYRTYLDAQNAITIDTVYDEESTEAAFLAIGLAQQQLPWHMLKTLCDVRINVDSLSPRDFSVEKHTQPPAACQIRRFLGEDEEGNLSRDLSGVTITLASAPGEEGIYGFAKDQWGGAMIEGDFLKLRAIYQARKEEFEQLKQEPLSAFTPRP